MNVYYMGWTSLTFSGRIRPKNVGRNDSTRVAGSDKQEDLKEKV